MLRTRGWILWFGLAFFALPISAKDQHHHERAAAAPEEKTFSGTVEKVNQRYCEICRCEEVTLTLKTQTEVLEVRVGPKPYLEEHDFAISRGDMIDITGIRFREAKRMVVLASEIRKGGDTLNLRGKFGRPAWVQHHGHTCPVCGN
jgi:hypothetical protein